jgi:hypothetical protein
VAMVATAVAAAMAVTAARTWRQALEELAKMLWSTAPLLAQARERPRL